MEKYFPIVSKSSYHGKAATGDTKGGRNAARYQPYEPSARRKSSRYSPTTPMNGAQLSSSRSALNKFLLDTLAHPSNPITHSDIGQRSDQVFSTSTGHQVSDGRRSRLHFEDKKQKLNTHQTHEKEADSSSGMPQIFRNVRVYINGFLENTTDIEMKRIVRQSGGQIVSTASQADCTHILTSQQLSGAKTHRILATKMRTKVHVVKPEWVLDSVKAGKRKLEQEYSIIKLTTTRDVRDMLTT